MTHYYFDEDFDSLGYCFARSAGRNTACLSERSLWCAVLEQALIDAGVIAAPTQGRPRQLKDNLQFHDAVRFLTRDRVDFPVVCELAGVNAVVVRSVASKQRSLEGSSSL